MAGIIFKRFFLHALLAVISVISIYARGNSQTVTLLSNYEYEWSGTLKINEVEPSIGHSLVVSLQIRNSADQPSDSKVRGKMTCVFKGVSTGLTHSESADLGWRSALYGIDLPSSSTNMNELVDIDCTWSVIQTGMNERSGLKVWVFTGATGSTASMFKNATLTQNGTTLQKSNAGHVFMGSLNHPNRTTSKDSISFTMQDSITLRPNEETTFVKVSGNTKSAMWLWNGRDDSKLQIMQNGKVVMRNTQLLIHEGDKVNIRALPTTKPGSDVVNITLDFSVP